MKKVWGANEVVQFIVIEATDAAGKPSHFYCRVQRKDVSVLTHGPHEFLRHYQGVKHFALDQRLRLEAPGWRVLDFEGNPLSESELERRKDVLRGPLVVQDREYPFAEDLIVDESGALDATLPVVAKVLSLIEVLRLGGPYELVSQLWSQFTLIASRVNIDVAWYRDEVLVGIVLLLVATCTCSLVYCCCVLVDHLEWIVPPHSCSCFCLGKGSWEVQHRVRGTRFRELGHGADMGEVHISTCLRCRAEPVQCEHNLGGYSSGQSSRCCWSRYCCGAASWRSAFACRGFCKLSGKWVSGEAHWIPHIRSAAVEALSSAHCFVCFWEPWPVLPDWVCCEPVERSRNSRLDGFSSSFAQGCHHKWSVYAGPCWCGGEHCWGMALDCVLPQRNWPQGRRR